MTKEEYKAFLSENLIMLDKLSKDEDICYLAHLSEALQLHSLKLEIAERLYRLETEPDSPLSIMKQTISTAIKESIQ